MYTKEEMEIANKTARSAGAVGPKAVLPELIWRITEKTPNASILDYGAGPKAIHSVALKMTDRPNVTAHEFGNNVNPEVHRPDALERVYDFVFASNVMNVQSNPQMLYNTLLEIYNTMHKHSVLFFNYPKSPRKMPDLDTKGLLVACEGFFMHVEHYYPKKNIIKCALPLLAPRPALILGTYWSRTNTVRVTETMTQPRYTGSG